LRQQKAKDIHTLSSLDALTAAADIRKVKRQNFYSDLQLEIKSDSPPFDRLCADSM